MTYCGFRRALAWFFAAALRERELDSSPRGPQPGGARARRPLAAPPPVGLGLRVLRPLAESPASLPPGRQTPAPAPVGGAAQRPRPLVAPPRPARRRGLPPAPRCGARLRWPSPRSSHDGGCSLAALSPRRAVGAVGAGRAWGPRRPGTNVSFCVSLTPSFPRARRAPPTSQEGLDDGPDFLSEEDRGVSSTSSFAGPSLPPPPWPWGVGRGRVRGRAPPLPRRPPFSFLATPRPALLQPFLPRGRWVLISWRPAAPLWSPPRLGPRSGPPPPPGSGRR